MRLKEANDIFKAQSWRKVKNVNYEDDLEKVSLVLDYKRQKEIEQVGLSAGLLNDMILLYMREQWLLTPLLQEKYNNEWRQFVKENKNIYVDDFLNKFCAKVRRALEKY